MIAQKVLSKFFGWVRHSPTVQREQGIAEQEFLGLKPVDRIRHELAQGLFLDWFWFERPLTSTLCAPIALFARERLKSAGPDERTVLAAMEKAVFSLYEVRSARPAQNQMELRDLMRDVTWAVHDQAGSRNSFEGDILIARVIPLKPVTLITGWAAKFPADVEEFERNKKDHFKGKPMPPMRPRDVLELFIEKVDWDSKGGAFVRTKLAGLWQRWSPGLPFKELERIVGEEQIEQLINIQKAFLGCCPADEERKDAMALLMAYWNWHAGIRIGKKPPHERASAMGPVERELGRRMTLYGANLFTETGRTLSSDETQNWFRDPQNGKNGKTPLQMIQEERQAMGAPDRESMDIRMVGAKIDAVTPEEREGDCLWREGNDAMMKQQFAQAVVKLEAAYTRLKHHTEVNFRVIGNLGLCYAILGRKEDAVAALQGALTHNPDYDLARGTLSRLLSMTHKEYERFRREASTALTKTEWTGK